MVLLTSRSTLVDRSAFLLIGLVILAGNAQASIINLNEVCLSPLSEFLYGHLGVCGSPPNLYLPDEWDSQTWSFKPQCLTTKVDPTQGINDTYCIFTSRHFGEGRGITLFTTMALAAEMATKPAFAQPDSIKGINDLINPPWGPPPYEKKILPGKGFGMIANRTIFRGERIMQETPSLAYNRDVFTLFSDEDRIPLQWHQAHQLPRETGEELLALHKAHGGDEIDDLMRTNAFGAYYGDPYVLHNNVLPRISRFNHDCRPSAHYYFDPDTMTQYVHAVRTIMPGEEIVINYTDSEYSFAERRHAIHLSWGFDCACSICRQPDTHIQASDARLAMIKKLKEQLNDWTEIRPDRAEMAETLVTLYEQERLDVPIATAYEAAAYAYAIAGNEHKARKFAALSVEAMTILYGADHPLTMDLEVMMLNPKDHRTWLYEQDVPEKKNETSKTVSAEESESSKWSFF